MLVKESLCETPIPLERSLGDPHELGGFGRGKAREKAEHDELVGSGVLRLEMTEGLRPSQHVLRLGIDGESKLFVHPLEQLVFGGRVAVPSKSQQESQLAWHAASLAARPRPRKGRRSARSTAPSLLRAETEPRP